MKAPKRHEFYRHLYPRIVRDIEQIRNQLACRKFSIRKKFNVVHRIAKVFIVYNMMMRKIVSGLRDNTIKIWDRKTLECVKVLTGHSGSVLCLQYDEKVIVTGSSDSTVRVWSVKTGELIEHTFTSL